MPAGPTADIVLCGYRNDLARVRVAAWLARNREAGRDPLPPDPAAPTPRRLYANLDLATARDVAAQLEALGALVRCEPIAGAADTGTAPARRVGDRRGRGWLIGAGAATVLAAWLLAATAGPPHGPRARPQGVVPATVWWAPPEVAPALPPRAGDVEGPAGAGAPVDAAAFRQQLDEIETALAADPDHPVLLRNLQTVLHNWGVAELNAHRLDAAIERLTAAADLGERFEVLRALGIAHLRRGEVAAAIPLLERALDLAPHDATTLLGLADARAQSGDRAAALALLERVRDSGADVPGLEERIAQIARELDAEWDFVEVQDAHFRISFGETADRSVVSAVHAALDGAYHDVGARLAYYPETQTPVVLYPRQDFHAVTRTPDWASGAYDGRIKIPVGGLDPGDPQLQRIVRHEYAHSLVHRLAGAACPVWLSEGVAVWAEEEVDGERAAWAAERISGRELFALGELGGSFVSLPGDRVDVAYAQSYLAVRALVDRYGAPRLRDLLVGIRRTGAVATAFAEVYPETLAAFEQRLLDDLTR